MRCNVCQRDVSQVHRGMCPACYKAWRKQNASPNATCEHCGRAFFNSSQRRHSLCSRECFRAWKIGRSARNEPIPGRQRPSVGPDGKVALECECCGRSFGVRPYEFERQPRFCSLRCNAERRVVPRTFLDCDHCGRQYSYLPNRLLLVTSRYCSRECREEARCLNRLASEADRGRSYRRFRDEQVGAAGRCGRCGSVDDLVLHHRIRSRERPDLLLVPENVEVLCRSCHTRIHGREGHFRLPEVAA